MAAPLILDESVIYLFTDSMAASDFAAILHVKATKPNLILP